MLWQIIFVADELLARLVERGCLVLSIMMPRKAHIVGTVQSIFVAEFLAGFLADERLARLVQSGCQGLSIMMPRKALIVGAAQSIFVAGFLADERLARLVESGSLLLILWDGTSWCSGPQHIKCWQPVIYVRAHRPAMPHVTCTYTVIKYALVLQAAAQHALAARHLCARTPQLTVYTAGVARVSRHVFALLVLAWPCRSDSLLARGKRTACRTPAVSSHRVSSLLCMRSWTCKFAGMASSQDPLRRRCRKARVLMFEGARAESRHSNGLGHEQPVPFHGRPRRVPGAHQPCGCQVGAEPRQVLLWPTHVGALGPLLALMPAIAQ